MKINQRFTIKKKREKKISIDCRCWASLKIKCLLWSTFLYSTSSSVLYIQAINSFVLKMNMPMWTQLFLQVDRDQRGDKYTNINNENNCLSIQIIEKDHNRWKSTVTKLLFFFVASNRIYGKCTVLKQVFT